MKKEKTLFQKIMIALGVLFVVLVIASIILQKVIDYNQDKIFSAMEQEITGYLSDDEYVQSVVCSRNVTTIVVPTSFAKLSNKTKINKCKFYILYSTNVRKEYFDDSDYVSVYVVDKYGTYYVESDHSGKIEVQ